MGERGKDPKEKRCGICGKDIYAGEEWAYKRKYHGEKTIWFCSYKCMRAYDATIGEPKKSMEEPEKQPEPPKGPTSRAEQAKALAREILAGRSVIAWLKKEGYKNPHEAYSAVRHYAQTKMPELAETLKPLKDLPKAPQAARTGRPRKYPAEVVTVEKVPEVKAVEPAPTLEGKNRIRELLEPVQCIAHVTAAELTEAEEPEEPEKPKVDPKAAMEGLSKALSDFGNNVFTKDRVLRILDEAALKCQEDSRMITMSTAGVKAVMFQNANVAARNEGIMRLRKEIRRMLEADEDE